MTSPSLAPTHKQEHDAHLPVLDLVSLTCSPPWEGWDVCRDVLPAVTQTYSDISWVHRSTKKAALQPPFLCWNWWPYRDLFPLQITPFVRGLTTLWETLLVSLSLALALPLGLAYLPMFPSRQPRRNAAQKGASPVLPLLILMQLVTAYLFKKGLSGMMSWSVSCSSRG